MKQICLLILLVFLILSCAECQDTQDRIDDSSTFTIGGYGYQYSFCDTPGCIIVNMIGGGDTLLSIEGDTTKILLKLILQFFTYSSIVRHLEEYERLIQGELKKH